MLKKKLFFSAVFPSFLTKAIVGGCFFLVEHFDREFISFSFIFWQGKSQHFLSENSAKQRKRAR